MFTLKYGDYTFPNQTFEVEGFPISASIRAQVVARKDGGVIQGGLAIARKFKIKGRIHNDTQAASIAELDDLQAALIPGKETPQDFQYIEGRVINSFLNKLTVKQVLGTDHSVLNIQATLVSDNPYFVATGSSSSFVLDVVGNTSFDITSNGNVENSPIIYFMANAAAIVDDIQLDNSTTSQQLIYRGTVLASNGVLINNDNLTVLNNSEDDISNFEGDFIELNAGVNTIVYAGATCQIGFLWKDRWF